MTSRWFGALLGLAASAGCALAETPPPSPPADAAEAATTVADGEGSAIAPDAFAPGGRAWLSADYLLWKVPRESVPVLVGTIPAIDAELSRTLPAGTIHSLFGGAASPVDFGMESGWRVDGGCWFDPDQGFGLEGAGFQLPSAGRRAGFSSGGDPVVGPVFQDATVNQAVLIMDSVPGLRTGFVNVALDNALWGAELNARHRVGGGLLPVPLDLLAGFRFVEVDEGLDVSGESTSIPGGRAPCG